jgi:hypothetical protein
MLHVLAITLVALAMAPAVAHALELPGKVRLPKEAYVTVQQIYYPGFTIAGVGEFAAFIAVALLLWSTPRGSLAFWLALGFSHSIPRVANGIGRDSLTIGLASVIAGSSLTWCARYWRS